MSLTSSSDSSPSSHVRLRWLAARVVALGDRGAEPVVLRRGGRIADGGGGWRRPSVDRGGSRREGTIGASMGDSSARKRRDRVLGPGPASEELWDDEKERRGERYVGAMDTGSDLEGTGGARSCSCT